MRRPAWPAGLSGPPRRAVTRTSYRNQELEVVARAGSWLVQAHIYTSEYSFDSHSIVHNRDSYSSTSRHGPGRSCGRGISYHRGQDVGLGIRLSILWAPWFGCVRAPAITLNTSTGKIQRVTCQEYEYHGMQRNRRAKRISRYLYNCSTFSVRTSFKTGYQQVNKLEEADIPPLLILIDISTPVV